MRVPLFRCGCCAGVSGPRRLGRRATLALAAGGLGLLARPARAQNLAPPPEPTSPDAAVQSLLEGNARYAADDVESLDQDTAILSNGTVSQQPVFAAVLACTDLAVPVDLIFDQPIGRIHTVKTAGNIVTPDAVAGLDYAVAGQGAVAVLVLSHSGCATIAAAIKARPPLGQPGPYAAFARAVFEGRGDAAVTARLNALIQGAALLQASRQIAGRREAKRLALVAAYLDEATGRVAVAS